MSDANAPFRVTRKVGSTAHRAIAGGVAVIMAIALLWFQGPGATLVDGLTRLGFSAVLILLILGFGGSLVFDLIRGGEPLLEVDSSGILIKGMPRLTWQEVAQVRTEELVGFNYLQTKSNASLEVGGFELELAKGGVRPLEEALAEGELSVRNRLGIVPRDSSLRPRRGPLAFISDYAERKSQETAARIGRKAIEKAPFGLWEQEMNVHFEEVVAAIRRFHQVDELSDLKPSDRSRRAAGT